MNGPDKQYDGLTAFAPITNIATTKKKGLLSADDKAKLDTLAHPVNRLSYAAASNLMNATALTAGVWTDLIPNQSFTVTDTAAYWIAEIRLCALVLAGGIITSIACRALIDGATVVPLPGGIVNPSTYGALSVGALIQANNFAAGSHTIKVQFVVSQASTGYCRAGTNQPYEFANLVIVEYAP